MNKQKNFCPTTPGGTVCLWLLAKSKRKAIRNLLKDAVHMPYKNWEEFYKRGYRIEKLD